MLTGHKDSERDVSFDKLCSVITPVYNGAEHIRKNIENVSGQSIRVHEHIIVDDGSSDDTLDIISELQKTYNHIKVFTQSNQGAGVARNLAISKATGKYIVFLDSDDTWHTKKLEAQIEFMETSEVAFSFGDYQEIDDLTNGIIHTFDLPASLTYKQLLNGCPIGCLTAAYNQNLLGKVFMPPVRRGQDWGLWLALTRAGAVARKYPGLYASYNRLPSSLSKNKLKKMLDIYKIYTEQEGLGAFRSIYHLLRHSMYVLTKYK